MRIVFSTLILLCFFSAYSQKSEKEKYLHLLAKKTCECVEARKLSDSLSAENLQTEMGLCIIKGYSSNIALGEKMYGKIIGNDSLAEKLGEEVGLKMITECPDTFKKLVNAYSEVKTEQTQPPAVFNPSLLGKVIEIKKGDFIVLSLMDSSKRIHNFIFLMPFEGADLLISNSLKKNDDVEVKYFEEEFYDPKLKDYKYYKILQSLVKK